MGSSSGLIFSIQPFLSVFADQNIFEPRTNLADNKKILVLIHLAGGNDWFNTVIPYQNAAYYRARPQLAISRNQILPLNNVIGLHPAMSGVKALYEQNKIAVLLNVGHDQPTLSHHKAIASWQQAYGSKHEESQTSDITWINRYAQLIGDQSGGKLIYPAINVEPFLPLKERILTSFLSAENNFTFNVDVHYRLDPRRNACSAPASNIFTCQLSRVANLIARKYNATIYNISLGGFDTHSNQSIKHQKLLQMLSEAIFSFQQELEKNGSADDVLILVYSEFGRSLKENSEGGTDHGSMNNVLITGNGIKGGVYGNLNHYTRRKSTPPEFDFRQVYATVLERWLDCPSKPILGKNFAPINFI